MPEGQADVLSDTLSAFLTSSLNVELVYTILKGIRRFVKAPDNEALDSAEDFSEKLYLDNIKIRNFKLWENAHQRQFINDPNMPFENKVD